MKEIWDAIVGFFRRLFGGSSTEYAGGGGTLTTPTNTQSIAYFFYKVATVQTVYTNFTTDPPGTVRNDPNLSQPNKDIITGALATGGWNGYQAVAAAMSNEAGSSGAVVWICVWIVVPPHHP